MSRFIRQAHELLWNARRVAQWRVRLLRLMIWAGSIASWPGRAIKLNANKERWLFSMLTAWGYRDRDHLPPARQGCAGLHALDGLLSRVDGAVRFGQIHRLRDGNPEAGEGAEAWAGWYPALALGGDPQHLSRIENHNHQDMAPMGSAFDRAFCMASNGSERRRKIDESAIRFLHRVRQQKQQFQTNRDGE